MSIKDYYSKNLICPFREGVKCYNHRFQSTDVFVAVSSKESKVLKNIIREILMKNNLGYYEAVKDVNQSAKDIWCVNICRKFIQAPFCIIILNKEEKTKKGNPNVYFEFGAIKWLNKGCIPIAKSSKEAEFDIRGLDTLIYKNKTDLNKKLHKRIQLMIKKLKLFPMEKETVIDNNLLSTIDYFIKTIETSKNPEILNSIAKSIYSLSNIHIYDIKIKLLPFIIKHLDHEDENVPIQFLQILNNLGTQLRDNKKIQKQIKNEAVPKLMKLVDFQKNGAIRKNAFECLLTFGDKRFVSKYLEKAIFLNDQDYKDLGLILNTTNRPFLKKHYIEIISGLISSMEEGNLEGHRITRIQKLVEKLNSVIKP